MENGLRGGLVYRSASARCVSRNKCSRTASAHLLSLTSSSSLRFASCNYTRPGSEMTLGTSGMDIADVTTDAAAVIPLTTPAST